MTFRGRGMWCLGLLFVFTLASSAIIDANNENFLDLKENGRDVRRLEDGSSPQNEDEGEQQQNGSSAETNDETQTPDCKTQLTCEECQKIAKKLFESQNGICIWTEEDKCQTGPATGQDSSIEDMCKKSPEIEDRCKLAKTCEQCDVTSTGEEATVCIWNEDNDTCNKGSVNDKKVGSSCDLCKPKTNCNDCIETSSQLNSQKNEACIWNSSAQSCTKGIRNEATDVESICGTTASEGGFSTIAVGVVLIAIFGLGYYVYRKKKYSAVHHGELSGSKRFHKSAVYEGVATNENEREDADDWDWNNDGGDVELASGQMTPTSQPASFNGSQYQDDEKTPPLQKKRLVRRSTSRDKEDVLSQATSSMTMQGMVKPINSGSPHQPHQPRSSPTPGPSAAIPPMPVQHVTKLGSPSNSGRKVASPPIPKKEEDDIFAEMGLAAKPTFSQPSSRQPAAPSTGLHHRTVGASHILSVPEDTADADDWGDDKDLDDLLDD